MVKRLRSRKGQSILEYLVIATVIVAAILAIRGTVQTNMNTLYTNAAAKTQQAGTALSGLQVESVGSGNNGGNTGGSTGGSTGI